MFVKSLRVENFKSIESLDLSFQKFNVVIGANASGKSNVIHIFEWLRNIANHGLQNAISMEGGTRYLRNVKLGGASNLRLSVTYNTPNNMNRITNDIGIRIVEACYEFSIHFNKRGSGFKIEDDKLRLLYRFSKIEEKRGKVREVGSFGEGSVIAETKSGKFRAKVEDWSSEIPKSPSALIPVISLDNNFPHSGLLIESPVFSVANEFNNPFENITIFNFDPKLAKKATSISGLKKLEEDGGNLPIILRNILQNKASKRRFLNLVKNILPFVENVNVQGNADRSLIFTLQEQFAGQSPYFPASLLSDGTVNLVAMIAGLYFQDLPILIVEEPERNLHPSLISNLVEMFREVSENTQIVVTTHNPELVRHATIDNLLLVTRDHNGFSKVQRPIDNETLMTFLMNDMGIDELYVQNLLGVGIAG